MKKIDYIDSEQKVTGFQQVGGQHVDEHLAAELAHVLHDGRVDQLDAD